MMSASHISTLDEGQYTRQESISWWDQECLRRATVLVVGAGALGNEILKNLALLGVGRIVLVDFDRIEMSNLSRSVLFRREDLGRYKACVAAERLKRINPDVEVLPITKDVRWGVGLGLVRRADVVLSGLDSVGARLALNQKCWRVGSPWFDGAIHELDGFLRVFSPPEGACFECNLSQADYQQLSARYSCHLVPRQGLVEAPVPTTSLSASVIAAWQVQEAVKWLHGMVVEGSRGIRYHGLSHEVYPLHFVRRADCVAHSPMTEISSLSGFGAEQRVAELFERLAPQVESGARVLLGHEVVTSAACAHCGAVTRPFQPLFELTESDTECPQCGSSVSFQMTHWLEVDGEMRDMVLRDLGIPPLHIVTVVSRAGDRSHFELTGDLEREPWGSFFRGDAHGES